MGITRDLSKVAEQPLKLLPTRQERINHKKQRNTQDSTGPAWFNMAAADITPELEKDVKLLQMRAALDPKQHYKKGERILQGKYFQVGTVVNDATSHYSHRLTKRQQGGTVLDTLMRDTKRQQYFKKKYNALQEASVKAGKAPYLKRKQKQQPWKYAKE
ncbi:hypothetical protein PSACC_03696 [Paramicrosporidium saccamoebae]|uniref:Fcf2 pre-rRNA processing C-terminal domain-containing protein n=1 Tax=Paramicrosporidium saccamoebae TaxID=1246581 RepID=A0A2H9TFP1_9FUNG|nr:hypothetical protein PSACC_03696 [Paramicrosporidium saccamoebae]